MFSSALCKIFKNIFFAENVQATASNHISINYSEGKLAKETVNYDTEIKVYQHEPEERVIEKISRSERTCSTHIFKEVARHIVWYDCQRCIPMSAEKGLLPQKLPKSVPKVTN